MTFLNPWGLLALLAIPVIIGLHFFRQQKKARQVGGLHLWDFARIATPAGGRFERLLASLPLLFQLLAALLLALLIAGLDMPRSTNARHYSVIVDDSVSMQARVKDSVAAQRARDGLTGWAREGDRFTLVAAGSRPAILAGPAATRKDFLAALAAWTPASPVANLDDAVNIATKFGSQDSRILLVTDNPDQANHLQKSVTIWGLGRAAPNNAIVFADRFKIAPEKERIVATVEGFAGPPRKATLTAYHGETAVGTRPVDIETSKPVSIEMELPLTPDAIRLELSPGDSLTVDDTAIVVPAEQKPVRVYLPEDLPQRNAFVKAATAVKETYLAPDIAGADLTIAAGGSAPAVRRAYQFSSGSTTTGLRMAAGRDLVTAPDSPLAHNLTLAGVIWPFDGGATPDARTALRADISYTSIPLLYADRTTSAGVRYRVNLALDATNIFRTTAWPVLMMNMVEECRSALPGLARTNLRAGEDVRMNLELASDRKQIVTLWREGTNKPLQQWQELPPNVLTDLEPGSYSIRQGTSDDNVQSPVLARFRVNLFSPGESDLAPLNELEPNLKAMAAGKLEQTERNMLLFYGLLMALLACVVLGWIYQDAGH